MANITRIKNNQITDSTITYAKIASGTLVGSNFNPDLTLNSNVTIIGNLSVNGNTETLNSVNTYIQDPLVTFNAGYTGSISSYNIGMIVNRNWSSLSPYGSVNTAWVWVEADQAFEAIATTTSGNALTSLTNSGFANLKVGNITSASLTTTGTVTAGSFVGPISSSSASFTTLVSTNLSSGNVVFTGGYVNGLANISATQATLTNLSSGNVVLTGGYVNGLANISATQGTITNFSSANISGVTNGFFTTLVATNFSSGNAQITGGYATGLTNLTATTAEANNFSSPNVVITGGYVNGLANISATQATVTNFFSGNINGTFNGTVATTVATANVALYEQLTNSTVNATTYIPFHDKATGNAAAYTNTALNFNPSTGVLSATSFAGTGNFTTAVATNFSSGNAQITGGYARGLTDASVTTLVATNFSSGNAQITGGYARSLTDLSATTAVATNLSSGNVVLTGGYVNGLANISATQATLTNLSSGNVVLTGGYVNGLANISATQGTVTNFSSANISGVTNGFFTTLVATNFSSGNAQITGGYARGLTDASVTTLVATNLSSGNARITGGYADNFPIGANTAATGAFTTLSASGITTLTNSTNATGVYTGALQVTGGASIGKDLWVGGNVYANAIVSTTQSILTIQDSLVYFQAPSPYGAYNYDQGFYSDMTSGVYQHTGVVRNHNTGIWNFFSNVASEPAANVINWSDTGIVYDAIKAGSLTLANSTASTSTSTGALVVTGGAGIGGALYAGSINTSSAVFTTLEANNFSSPNVVITGGYVNGLANVTATQGTITNFSSANISGVTNGFITTLVATNFSSGNAQITGGYARSLTDLSATTLVATNLSSGNVALTGGYVNGLANISATQGTITNLSSGNVVLTGGYVNGLANVSATQATITNLSSGNVVLTGGYINSLANISATQGTITNFSSANISGVTNGFITTLVATNLSSGNAQITGGYARGLTDATITTLEANNFSSPNVVITGGYVNGLANVSATQATLTNLSSGNVVITGGYVNGLANISATQGTITNFSSSNISGVTNGFITTLVATNFSSPNVKITGGYVNGLANVSATQGTFTNLSSGNIIMTGGYMDNVAIGANVSASGKFYTLVADNITRLHGNVVADSGVATTDTTTGALVVVGGVGITANVNVGGGTTFNFNGQSNYNTIIKGVTDSTLFWARPNSTYDQVLVGGSATPSTLVRGAKLQINSNDTILLPVGDNSGRPSNAGGTDIAGMFRYSTAQNAIEWYNGTAWQTASTQFTVITDEQFSGTGSQTNFTLGAATTTASTIVSINGVVQIPTLAYSITGAGNDTLTFTEAPASGDVIDVRRLATTQTVTSLQSATGKFQITVDDTNGTGFVTGTTGASAYVTTIVNASGAFISNIANVSVASANTPTTIDTIDNTLYRSAKYIVQVTNGSSYQAEEVLVISDGTTATAATYGIVQTNGNLGVIQATQSGTNTLVQFIAANATNNVRIKKDYLNI